MSTLKAINVQHPSASTTNIVNDASGNVAVGNNLTVAGTATVAGVAAIAVAPSTSGNVLTSNGTTWTSAAPTSGGSPSAIGQIPFSTNGSTYAATQKIVQGTAVASTSGTSIDFTGIPSWVKRVTVMLNGVSTSGTSNFLIQSGSGSIENTGYVSNSVYSNTGSSSTTSTAGFVINYSTIASSSAAVDGIIILAAMGSNLWAESHTAGSSYNGAALFGAGHKTFSGALDRVRITTVNGTDTFDAGSINILYE